jgi:PmbA protein
MDMLTEWQDCDRQQMMGMVQSALALAEQRGATAAEIGVSASIGLSVDVRMQAVETVEHCRDKGFGVTVYFDQRKGSASTTDTRPEAIAKTVEAACRIAQYTQPDLCAGLPEKKYLATEWPKDLSLYHPWDMSTEQAIDMAMACEALAMKLDKKIVNSEGASVNTSSSLQVYGNSIGFLQDFMSTRHGLSCSVIAEKRGKMQRDYSYTVARDAGDLSSLEWVAQQAAKRTLAKLSPKKIPTGEVPVIFAAEVATGLMGSFLSAINGANLYREASFLGGYLEQSIFPSWMSITEDPFVKKGLASCPYDAEGVSVRKRDLIRQGVLQGYLLDCYSARKLKMETTGNAGGAHNIIVSHQDKNLTMLLSILNKGLLVTDVMGQGINLVTGDYSRGASGFWVENGQIQYPVEEITVAGNLKDMYRGIQAIGNDVEVRGRILCGSVLIDHMRVGGD